MALAIIVASPMAASAQVWDEATVTRLASERAPRVLAARARARMVRSAAEGEGLLPNPELSWERQEAFAPNAQTQDVLTARVPLDLSGRPYARRALAELDASLEEADAARARLDAVASVLELFYRALATERRVRLLEEAQRTLDEASRVMERRREAGEVSGYAASRLALEAELGRSRVAEARAEMRAVTERLGVLLGRDAPEGPALRGEFAVGTPGSLESAIERARGREDVAALERARRAADRARSAADFAWIPRVEVEGGYNRQDGPVVGHGYAIGLSVEVPLFDHGQGERARAAAGHAAVVEMRDAMEARARAEIRAAHARLVALVAERQRFGRATEGAHELLLQAAESGYREGERSLLELLDARRAVLESATRALALDLAVRLADVRFRRATGDL